MSLEEALKVVKLAGFRVSKPRASRKKDRVGPTFVARFADGQVTRMSCYCDSDEKLDWQRGERLSIAAHVSRRRYLIPAPLRDAVFRMKHDSLMDPTRLAAYCARRFETTPAILECWFERDGVQLGTPLAKAA
jgi:hypothetical protein